MTGRRSKGSGTVYPRGDGRWVARLNGQRPQTVRTEALAWAKLAEMQKLAEQGQQIPSRRLTVADWLREWLALGDLHWEANTYAGAEGVVEGHLIPELGRIRLVDLTTRDVDSMLVRLHVPEQRGPGRLVTIRRVLITALNVAVAKGILFTNVAKASTKPRVPRTVHPTLEVAEAQRFLQAASTHRLAAAWTMVLTCGMRQGEVRGLRWSDIDWDGGVLHVRQAVTRDRRTQTTVTKEPKTGAGWRTIDLPYGLIAQLQAHRQVQADEREVAGDEWLASDLVFTHPRGGPLAQVYLWEELRHLMTAADLPPVHWRDMRSICTSLMAAQGVPLKAAMERLGHARSQTTVEIYNEVLGSQRREAAEQMDRLLNYKVSDKVADSEE